MIISGMSGNEIYCLGLKGFSAGELVVGNSVQSLGLGGAFGSWGSSLAGGEVTQITELISEGRHAAIRRMEEEARRHGAIGVAAVSSNLGTLANYTEFLAQGTAVHSQVSRSFFSTAASGIETYCHLDAGYEPVRFVMGNIAYALGIGRGLTGSLRQLAKGEVKEFSQMYNRIRHLALDRIKLEAHQLGANAVVDIATEILPFGPGTIEILMTGTASRRANLPPCASNMSAADHVVTSELSGEELWNLAKLGFVPVRLVMATSVYSLGVAAGIGAMLKSMSRGEIPEVTKLVYEARENCIALLREEAIRSGGERVIGNRLMIRELSPGLIEVVAIGTAVKRAPGFEPETPQLIPQAVITENRALSMSRDLPALPNFSPTSGAAQFQPSLGSAGGCLTGIVLVAIFFVVPMVIGFIALLKK